MNNKEYSFRAGLVFVILSVVFFLLPAYFNMDALIPIVLSMVSLIVGIFFFLTGLSQKSK